MVLRLFPVPSRRSVRFRFTSSFRLPLCLFVRSDLLSPAVPLDRCFVPPPASLPLLFPALRFRFLRLFSASDLSFGFPQLRCRCLSPRSRAAVSSFRGFPGLPDRLRFPSLSPSFPFRLFSPLSAFASFGSFRLPFSSGSLPLLSFALRFRFLRSLSASGRLSFPGSLRFLRFPRFRAALLRFRFCLAASASPLALPSSGFFRPLRLSAFSPSLPLCFRSASVPALPPSGSLRPLPASAFFASLSALPFVP